MKGLLFVILIMLTGIDVNAGEFKTVTTETVTYPIYFNQGKSTLKDIDDVEAIDINDAKVKVVGYASAEGDREYNARLSTARALYVGGILSNDVTIDSHGETMATGEAEPKDRRVDVIVSTDNVSLNPIFGEYSSIMGPHHHVIWETLPLVK